MEQFDRIKEKSKRISELISRLDNPGLSRIEYDILLSVLREIYMEISDLKYISDDSYIAIEELDKENNEELEETTIIHESKKTEPEILIEESKIIESVVEKEEVVIQELTSQTLSVNKTESIENVSLVTEVSSNGDRNTKVLGEQLGNNKTSLNEKFKKEDYGINARLNMSPLRDIKSGIGVGDRFLYIRELFNGKKEKFDETIDVLNGLSSMNDALSYLDSNYSWSPEDPTVITFLNLVKRRYN